jgi:hypothetical protein
MDISAIRRRNFSILLRDYSTQKELADALKRAPTFISQLRKGAEEGGRNIGNRLARDIEVKLGKTRGWMDSTHGGAGEEKEGAPTVRKIGAPPADAIQANPPESSTRDAELLRLLFAVERLVIEGNRLDTQEAEMLRLVLGRLANKAA